MKTVRALSLTFFIFGTLGWIYIAMNAVFHPETLPMPLTHFLSFPREDTFGVGCFLLAMVSFFTWSMLRHEK